MGNPGMGELAGYALAKQSDVVTQVVPPDDYERAKDIEQQYYEDAEREYFDQFNNRAYGGLIAVKVGEPVDNPKMSEEYFPRVREDGDAKKAKLGIFTNPDIVGADVAKAMGAIRKKDKTGKEGLQYKKMASILQQVPDLPPETTVVNKKINELRQRPELKDRVAWKLFPTGYAVGFGGPSAFKPMNYKFGSPNLAALNDSDDIPPPPEPPLNGPPNQPPPPAPAGPPPTARPKSRLRRWEKGRATPAKEDNPPPASPPPPPSTPKKAPPPPPSTPKKAPPTTPGPPMSIAPPPSSPKKTPMKLPEPPKKKTTPPPSASKKGANPTQGLFNYSFSKMRELGAGILSRGETILSKVRPPGL